MQILTSLEVQCGFGWDVDPGTSPRIAADPSGPLPQIEATEPPELNSLTLTQGHSHLLENGVDDAHDVTRQKIGMAGRKAFDQFRFVHA